MAAKRQHSSSKSRKEDVRRCRQSMRWLMEGLGHSLPSQQAPFQSALLLNFHHASTRAGLAHSLGSALKSAFSSKSP